MNTSQQIGRAILGAVVVCAKVMGWMMLVMFQMMFVMVKIMCVITIACISGVFGGGGRSRSRRFRGGRSFWGVPQRRHLQAAMRRLTGSYRLSTG